MPQISRFYGIIIYMYWKEHNPPHFHVEYQEYKAVVGIETLSVLEGKLPKTAMNLVLQWAFEHREALMDNWDRGRERKNFNTIAPLS